MYRYFSPIDIEYTPTATNHAVSVGYVENTLEEYATLENLNDVCDMAANTYATPEYVVSVKDEVLSTVATTYATKTELTTAVNGINLTLQQDYATASTIAATYATKEAVNTSLANYVTAANLDTRLASYVTTTNLTSTLGNYALTSALANYATSTSVSELRNYVDATFASTVTVRTMIETALDGYLSLSALTTALANYSPITHTHTSTQITDATRTGGTQADAGKVVLLGDGGKVSGAMVPVDGSSIVLSGGAIGVNETWVDNEIHEQTKTELETITGTTVTITKSGQYINKVIGAETTISLNTSGLTPDTNEIIEFDLLLNVADGVTVHLPGWMTEDGPLYNYGEAGKTLFHIWSYDGGATWNASKESWLPPDNWRWVTTLSDAIGHQGTSLRDAIGAASNGDVIKFIPELQGTITLEQGEITTDKALTIEGDKRITIDANNLSRILYFSAGVAILNGLTLINGETSTDGGGVYAYRGLTATDCVFIGNKVGTTGTVNFPHGGGVYVGSGDLVLTDCRFEENYAVGKTKGCYGGAIFGSGGSTTLTRCIFEGNISEIDGGNDQAYGTVALYSTTSVDISDCDFIGETSTYGVLNIQRGSAYNESPYKITNCTFKDGQALRGGGCYFVNTYAIIEKCSFEDNTVGLSGGAVISNTSNRITFIDCTFTGNQSASTGGVFSVYNTAISAEFIFIRCVFSNSKAASYAGTLLLGTSTNHPTVTISACTFTGNECGTNGSDVYDNQCGNVLIEDCVFEGSKAAHGVIYSQKGSAGSGVCKVDRCKFADAVISNAAGGVFETFSGREVYISNSIMTGCSVSFGCIVFDDADFTYANCTFSNNLNSPAGNRYMPARAYTGVVTMYNCVEFNNPTKTVPYVDGTQYIDYLLTDKDYSDDGYTHIITYDDSLPLFDEDGYTPLEDSQTIDAGNSEYVDTETDLNGDPRIQGTAVDLGAVEYGGEATANLTRMSITAKLNRINNSDTLDREELDITPITPVKGDII